MSGPAALRDDWERHWDAYAESVKSNPAQRLRRRVISRLLQLDRGSARVLDIGCGQGDLVAELRNAHPDAELCGIDYSQSGLDVASRKVPARASCVRICSRRQTPPPVWLAGRRTPSARKCWNMWTIQPPCSATRWATWLPIADSW